MTPTISGVGLGLRMPHIHSILEQSPKVPWFELLSENWLEASGIDGYLLDQIIERYPVALHGVALNIGGVDALNENYLNQLFQLAERCGTDWISDHLCFSSAKGIQLHDLLPLPRTKETIGHLVPRIQHAQERLKRRLTIENISAYVTSQENCFSEADFLNEIGRRTGCGFLVDVNNLYVNQVNLSESAQSFITDIDPSFVVEFHLGGYSDKGDYLLDAHNNAVTEPVWELYAQAITAIGRRPTLIEWDNDLPAFEVLLNQKQLAESVLDRHYA